MATFLVNDLFFKSLLDDSRSSKLKCMIAQAIYSAIDRMNAVE